MEGAVIASLNQDPHAAAGASEPAAATVSAPEPLLPALALGGLAVTDRRSLDPRDLVTRVGWPSLMVELTLFSRELPVRWNARQFQARAEALQDLDAARKEVHEGVLGDKLRRADARLKAAQIEKSQAEIALSRATQEMNAAILAGVDVPRHEEAWKAAKLGLEAIEHRLSILTKALSNAKSELMTATRVAISGCKGRILKAAKETVAQVHRQLEAVVRETLEPLAAAEGVIDYVDIGDFHKRALSYTDPVDSIPLLPTGFEEPRR